MNLHFGAMADSLQEQVESQIGIVFTGDEFIEFQANADAVTRLNIHGLISDSQAQAARKKIVKSMERIWKSKKKGGE
jgi:primosomal replication protein N